MPLKTQYVHVWSKHYLSFHRPIFVPLFTLQNLGMHLTLGLYSAIVNPSSADLHSSILHLVLLQNVRLKHGPVDLTGTEQSWVSNGADPKIGLQERQGHQHLGRRRLMEKLSLPNDPT